MLSTFLRGESGGLLTCSINGQRLVDGVCRFISGRGCNTFQKPTVFTRTSDYISWMNSVSVTDKDDRALKAVQGGEWKTYERCCICVFGNHITCSASVFLCAAPSHILQDNHIMTHLSLCARSWVEMKMDLHGNK